VKALFASWATVGAAGNAPRYEVKRVVGEGNFILVHAKFSMGGADSVVYDLFRVENGKVAEHWDVIEAVPATAEHANTQF
jgi:predicted SnoaL-like aldol condensation-catalyzing enzyme